MFVYLLVELVGCSGFNASTTAQRLGWFLGAKRLTRFAGASNRDHDDATHYRHTKDDADDLNPNCKHSRKLPSRKPKRLKSL